MKGAVHAVLVSGCCTFSSAIQLMSANEPFVKNRHGGNSLEDQGFDMSEFEAEGGDMGLDGKDPIFVPHPAGAGEGDRVGKLVKLLENIHAKSKSEAAAAKKAHDLMECECETEITAAKDTIALETKNIAKYENEISSLQAQNGVASEAVRSNQNDHDSKTQALAEAEAMRKKEKADFEAKTEELQQAISQTEQAIQILLNVGADQSKASRAHEEYMAGTDGNLGSLLQGLMQVASVYAAPDQVRAVRSLIQQGSQVPITGAHVAQSGEIVGILKGMKEKFESNLETAASEEAAAEKAFTAFAATTRTELGVLHQQITAGQMTLSENGQAVGAAKQALSASQTELSDAQTEKADKEVECKAARDLYAKESARMSDEQVAITKALQLLQSDFAFKLFNEVPTAAESFLQVATKSAFDQVAAALGSAQSGRVRSLASVATKSGAFAEVISAIEEVKKAIAEEAAADLQKSNWCVAEDEKITGDLKENKENHDQASVAFLEAEKTISDLDSQIASIKDKMIQAAAQAEKDDQAYAQDLATMGKNIRDGTSGVALLDKVLTVLNSHYDQHAEKGSATKILELLNNIKTDIQQGVDDNKQAHKERVTDHAESKRAREETKANRLASLATAEGELADAKLQKVNLDGTMKRLRGEKAAVEKYLESITPGCDFIRMNKEMRDANRQIEGKNLDMAIAKMKEAQSTMFEK